MISKTRRKAGAALLAALAVFSFSACTNNELNDSASPVLLVLSNTQNIDTIDLQGGASCATSLGTVLIQSIVKTANVGVDQRFNDVRLTRYRVSYRRTDGGTLVPAPFVLSMDLLITANSQAPLGSFRIFTTEALNQAPFAALFANNGGRDPETGRKTVSMDVTLEVFGETIAGANVSGSTTFPLTFCNDCGGCS